MPTPLTEAEAIGTITSTLPAFTWPTRLRPEKARRINFRLKKSGKQVPLHFLGVKELRHGAPSGQVAVLSVEPPAESLSGPVRKNNRFLLSTCSHCVIFAPIRSKYRLENWKVRGGKTRIVVKKRVATVTITPINGVRRFRSIPR